MLASDWSTGCELFKEEGLDWLSLLQPAVVDNIYHPFESL